jgi:branched-chain amino acid transport system substrate-binding protein
MGQSIKIGVCVDADWGSAADEIFRDSVTFAVNEAQEKGIVDRPIDVEYRYVEGLPRGSAHDVLLAWQELAAEGVLGIIGPFISDNCIAIRSYIERSGQVPTVSGCGTDRWYGEWCFGVSNGSLSEEPYLIANFLGHQGAVKIAAVVDRSAIGREYFDGFQAAADREGLQVTFHEDISQIESNLGPVVERARASNPDALLYLGFGVPAVHINKELERIGWDPLRVMNGAFMAGPVLPEGMESLKGWVGVDQYDEDNTVAREFLDRFEKANGYRPGNYLSCVTYDTATMLILGIGLARPMSPEGVKDGLEQVKIIPAASGSDGTYMSFGPFIRRAWLGANYLVMREATGGVSNLRGETPSVLRHRLMPRETA